MSVDRCWTPRHSAPAERANDGRWVDDTRNCAAGRGARSRPRAQVRFSMDEVLSAPHLEARGVLHVVEPVTGPGRVLALPWTSDGRPCRMEQHALILGEGNAIADEPIGLVGQKR